MNLNLKSELSKIINAFNSVMYDIVINKTTVLLKKNKNNDFLWNIKGLTLQLQKKYKLSISCLIKALQINPRNIAAINNLGISYKNTMDFAAAEECFNKVIAINPSYVKALINLGNLKGVQGPEGPQGPKGDIGPTGNGLKIDYYFNDRKALIDSDIVPEKYDVCLVVSKNELRYWDEEWKMIGNLDLKITYDQKT